MKMSRKYSVSDSFLILATNQVELESYSAADPYGWLVFSEADLKQNVV